MSKHKQGLVKALDYTLTNLKTIQHELFTVDAKKSELAWAVGGLIITITANTMKICEDVISTSTRSEDASAKKDLEDIRDQFNTFINAMIDYQGAVDDEKQ